MTTLLIALLAAFSQLQDLPHAFPRTDVKQILENERVTVWDVVLAKGKPTTMHRHKYDMVVVDLADATARVTSPEGAVSSSSTQAGRAYFFAKGMTHIEEGVSD